MKLLTSAALLTGLLLLAPLAGCRADEPGLVAHFYGNRDFWYYGGSLPVSSLALSLNINNLKWPAQNWDAAKGPVFIRGAGWCFAVYGALQVDQPGAYRFTAEGMAAELHLGGRTVPLDGATALSHNDGDSARTNVFNPDLPREVSVRLDGHFLYHQQLRMTLDPAGPSDYGLGFLNEARRVRWLSQGPHTVAVSGYEGTYVFDPTAIANFFGECHWGVSLMPATDPAATFTTYAKDREDLIFRQGEPLVVRVEQAPRPRPPTPWRSCASAATARWCGPGRCNCPPASLMPWASSAIPAPRRAPLSIS
jgi:hypothetical protein